MAQTSAAPQPSLDPLLQLMVTQPSIEVASNVQVTAMFDPPIVRPGEKAIYRVTFNALTDSILWPEKIPAPPQLQMHLSARGQTLVPLEAKLKPQTTINYHVRAPNAGSFTIPEFAAQVYGQRVLVPATTLEVAPQATISPPQSLQMEVADTNLFVGQPVKVRVLLRASAANMIQAIQDLHLNGDGFLIDQGTARQMISMVPVNGANVAAYQYETTLTPLVAGQITVSAQGFTAGNRFIGAIVIQGQAVIPGGPPQYLLVDSEPVTLNVRSLPRASELPGFTGAIGKLTLDPPQLSTNQTRVGDLIKLVITIRGEGNLTRLVPPPPPAVAGWQVFPAVAGGAPIQPGALPSLPGTYATFSYTLIPLTTNVDSTPTIPFSYFDPQRSAYIDLTISSVPIEVSPGAMPVEPRWVMQPIEEESAEKKKLKLSALATSPGRTVTSLTPLQLRSWFILVQVLPLIGFMALWQWDRRKRFLEQHPEIVLRRRARRELRRQRRRLRDVRAGGNETQFAMAAVNAMRIAVAPHYPAEPRALVSRDVLALLDESSNRGLVQQFFAVADASEFSDKVNGATGLIAQQSELDRMLNQLEAKL